MHDYKFIMHNMDDDEMVRESDVTQCQPSPSVEFTCHMIIIANSIFGKFVIVFENWRELVSGISGTCTY